MIITRKNYPVGLLCIFLMACGQDDGETHRQPELMSFAQVSLEVEGNVVDPVVAPGTQVAWVVSAAEGETKTYYVTLDQENPTAWDALQATDMNIVSADFGFGVAICALEGVGRQEGACFNELGEYFWAFYHQDEGAWVYSELGVADYLVSDGEVLGFAWTL